MVNSYQFNSIIPAFSIVQYVRTHSKEACKYRFPKNVSTVMISTLNHTITYMVIYHYVCLDKNIKHSINFEHVLFLGLSYDVLNDKGMNTNLIIACF